jgi:Spy/CpxP family protein refolding chaperone
MKFPHFVSGIFEKVLAPVLVLAVPLAVAAQQVGASPYAQGQRPAGILQAPGVAGYALGGPIGVLTDQQRASYEAALNRQRGLMTELQAQLRAARQDFVTTSVDQKFNETVLRQKAMAAYRCEAEMAVLRAKALSEVQPPLTPEQIEKIKIGQPGPVRPLRPRQQLENPAPHNPAVNTNTDPNGLPPKK